MLGGLDHALNEDKHRGKSKLDGKGEAVWWHWRAASHPPGYALVDNAAFGRPTRALRGLSSRFPTRPCANAPEKNELKPWQQAQWCIPESGLGVCCTYGGYPRLVRRSRRPLLSGGVFRRMSHTNWSVKIREAHCGSNPGERRRYDYHYQPGRNLANLFIAFWPRQGWRHITVTDRRTKARLCPANESALVDVFFPQALQIRLVLDNLNTHVASALYETFEPAEARRILRRLAFHLHPGSCQLVEHGRTGIGGYCPSQCLKRRIRQSDIYCGTKLASGKPSGILHATVDWRFTCEKARLNSRLYPP